MGKTRHQRQSNNTAKTTVMNKTIIININGIVFHIEEDAYEVLRAYMIDVKKHFGYTEDSHEIVNDIENRIAEMFSERISEGRKEVITLPDVQEVCAQMGHVSDFDTMEPSFGTETDGVSGSPASRMERKLFRDKEDLVFGGVCSGLGHYFGLEARWVRLLFILLLLFGGTGILLYLILWVAIPPANSRADRMAMRGEAPNLQNFKRRFDEEMEGFRQNFSGAGDGFRRGLHSAGSFLAKAFILLAKIISILFIVGACIALVALVISIIASFGWLGYNNDMAIFPFNVIAPEYTTGLLISALITVIVPIVALILLGIRILFNRPVMGRYVGFTLLIAWVTAVGFTAFYAAKTMADFREESTITEELLLERQPVYRLTLHDATLARNHQDSLTMPADRPGKRVISVRNNSLFRNLQQVRLRIVSADSLEMPALIRESSAKGSTFEAATSRAEKIDYAFSQQGEQLKFDKHFHIALTELVRDQRLYLKLRIPIGTRLIIDRELERMLWDIPFSQCAENYRQGTGQRPQRTEWVMASGGLKCAVEPPEPAL